MSTYKMLQTILDEHDCFSTDMHPAFKQAVNCISQNASYKMKLMMAVTEIAIFVSHLRKPIQMSDGTLVPINIMSFVLAGSGESKDSSVAMIRRALFEGYEKIDHYRKTRAEAEAKHEAGLKGNPDDWQKFYQEPRDLLPGIGSVEGQMNHWSILEKGRLGAACIHVNELGSELQNSKDIRGNIEALAKGYDLGRIPSKTIKSNENQVPSIKFLPINCLMFGAEEAILYNDTVKKAFIEEFMSKLSRRTYFNFNTEVLPDPEFKSLADLRHYKSELKAKTAKAVSILSPIFAKLVSNTTDIPLTLTPDAEDIYDVYLEFNNLHSKTVPKHHPMTALARKHMSWKAQKLAGVLAVLEQSPVITAEHMIYAIRFGELYSTDLAQFETELAKEPYEQFAAYMQSIAVDGKSTISLHMLRKLGYITATGAATTRIRDLVQLVTSYDSEAIYTANTSSIAYEHITPTPISGVSFIPVSGTKEQRAKQCAENFTFTEVEFKNLSNLLKKDYAYTSFEFRDGKRAKDNIINGIKWIVLDIDHSKITADEAHEILQDINHHIALTSDDSNDFKFRVLIELDAFATVKPEAWRHFIKSIADSLALTPDLLPQSQIFFSYAGREVLSVTDANPLEIRDHLLLANSQLSSTIKQPKPVTKAESQAKLNDPLGTFNFAYEAAQGEGSRSLIRAAYYARDLGMSKASILGLMVSINQYWTYPMDTTRFQNTILNVVERFDDVKQETN